MGFTALKLLSEGFGGVIPCNHQYHGCHLKNPTDIIDQSPSRMQEMALQKPQLQTNKTNDCTYQKNEDIFFLKGVWGRIVISVTRKGLASSSGGAAYPGGTRGQPRGSTSGVRG